MTDLLQGFLSGSAAWGVLLTLAAFALGALINKTTGKAIFNPLLLGSIFVIILLCAEHPLRRLQGQCRPGELSAAAGHHQPRHPAL